MRNSYNWILLVVVFNLISTYSFVEIITLVAWLKSTLILKMECQYAHIYMKTECLQTKWDTTFFGWERIDRVSLIESLNFSRLEGIWSKMLTDANFDDFDFEKLT